MVTLGDLTNKGSYLLGVMGCKYVNVEQLDLLKERLEKAEAYTKYAGTISVFSKKKETAENLIKMSETISKIKEPVVLYYKSCSTIESLMKLANAIDVLRKWSEPNSQVSTKEAADAFDTLSGALAAIIRKLGSAVPIVGQYALIFEEISKNRFFSNYYKIANPETRGNSSDWAAIKQADDAFKP
ncbi:hypothetical protein J5J86_03500 [Aquabacter sp. L1I39]|uniref:hypothetical protein n=1 Tax=Aquabacter sp. L1I39 TaxID=2820278 RepID=UPI001ADBE113|nr:hypothetical protein [Aquabacter sp. L1I39]QTL04420.1 hypothetical protein J5J86_03500 [Aquabacter sp. L1I39]